MPESIETTCDICGERATAYRSFFELLNEAEHELVPVPGHDWLCKRAPRRLVVSTRGCRRPGLVLYLCDAHFKSLEAACEAWFAEILEQETASA